MHSKIQEKIYLPKKIIVKNSELILWALGKLKKKKEKKEKIEKKVLHTNRQVIEKKR